MKQNPIENFQLQKTDFKFFGQDLNKPVAIIATQDQHLLVTDARGGVSKLSLTTGKQQLIIDKEKGEMKKLLSLTLFDQQHVLLANMDQCCIEKLNLNTAKREMFCHEIEGKPIGKVDFLLRDSKKRIWISVATRADDDLKALNPDVDNGYIAVYENGRFKIVAEGFAYTNKMVLDKDEKYLYVSETGRKRINRFKINSDGTLGHKEIYGPSDLGPAAFVLGIAFDSFGNLWGTMASAEKIFAITPEGDQKIIFDDGDPQMIKKVEEAYQQRALTWEVLLAKPSAIAPVMATLTFAGPDLQTVYIGTLLSKTLPYFRAPVRGQ